MDATVTVALFMIISIVLFGTILSWMNRNKKKKERENLTADFDDFVIKNHLTIDKKQFINKNIIGIDRLNLRLVFLDNSENFRVFHLINLEDISGCRLIKLRNEFSGHISNIFLQCTFKKNPDEIALPFYNEMKDEIFKMLRLSKKASYWEKSIHIFREAAQLSAQNEGR